MLFLCNKGGISGEIEQRMGKKEEGWEWGKRRKSAPPYPSKKLQF